MGLRGQKGGLWGALGGSFPGASWQVRYGTKGETMGAGIRVVLGVFGAAVALPLLGMEWERFLNAPPGILWGWAAIFGAGHLVAQLLAGFRLRGWARLGNALGVSLLYGTFWRVFLIPSIPDLPASPDGSSAGLALGWAGLLVLWLVLWRAPRRRPWRVLGIVALWLGVFLLPNLAEFREWRDLSRWTLWGVPPENATPLLSLESLSELGEFPFITQVVGDPGNPGALLLVCRSGEVFRVRPGQAGREKVFELGPFRFEGEEGLYGIAFAPGFQWEGPESRIFVRYGYTQDGVWNVLSSLRLRPGKPLEETELIRFQGFRFYHFGGGMAFGPDGYLYVGFGDNNHPNSLRTKRTNFLSKVLRIDVSGRGTGGKPYRIPPDNPFRHHRWLPPETFATGLRNPFKLSFGVDGQLIVAEVGTNLFEEINLVRAGKDYGWPKMEGRLVRDILKRYPYTGPYQSPAFFYPHNSIRTCLLGGTVYQGTQFPELVGHYLFGDVRSGEVFGVDARGGRLGSAKLVALLPGRTILNAIGVAEDIYVAAGGRVFRVTTNPGRPRPLRISGEELFGTRCSRCHGAQGQGGDYYGNFIPSFRDRQYHELRTDAYLAHRIRFGQMSGRYPFMMPPWGEVLGEKEIAKLIRVIRKLGESPPHHSE